MQTVPVTTVDLIRHGEPVGGSRIRGQIDDPLSSVGWQQMRSAVAGACPWDVLITSPLRRCRAFAEELAAQHGLPLVEEPGLKEIGFGEWEGHDRQTLTATDPLRIVRFHAEPSRFAPAGAEPLDDFRARVARVWDQLLPSWEGRRVLVVCHAGIIRMSLCHMLGMPAEHMFRIKVPYAGLTRMQVETVGGMHMWTLVCHAVGSISEVPR